MRTYTIAGIALISAALSSATAAQTSSAPQRYDDYGNALVNQPGPPAPGDIMSTIPGPESNSSGVAPYGGDIIVTNYQGFGTAHHVSESTGALLATFPIGSGDFGLGYDASRDLIISTNASSDNIKGWTPGSSVPVFDFPAPGAGPVGAAWDPTRDEYGICDWTTNMLYIIDPVSHATLRSFDLSGTITRLAGVGYDCINDSYIVAGRDQAMAAVIDPDTGAIMGTYASVTGSGNNFQGLALSSNGGIWAGEFVHPTLYEQETIHDPAIPSCVGGGVGTEYCTSNPNSTGSAASLTIAGSDSIAANDFTVTSRPVPNQPSIFFYANMQLSVPFGHGVLCAGGTIVRSGVVFASGNEAILVYDTVAAGFLAGTTRNFQHWFRDPAAGAPAFNTSSAVAVTFTP